MRRKHFMMHMVALCFLVSAAVGAGAASSRSAAGTWKLDVAKSSYGKMATPKFEQLVIVTDAPNSVKWNLKGISSDGRSYISMYDGPVDGKDHPMTSNENASTVSYTRTASSLHWVTKDKSGAVIATGSNQLSADGNTLTIKGMAQGPNGQESFVSVFERVQ